MFLRLCLVLIIMNLAKCEIQLVNRDKNHQIFIKKFVLQQFQKLSSIGILYNVSDPWSLRLLQDVNENFMATVLLDYSMINISEKWSTNNQYVIAKESMKTDANILILENTKKLCDILRYSQSYSLFNTRKHMLLVMTDTVKFTDSWIKEIFTCLWEVLIIDVAVLFDNEGRTNIYTYIPWTDPFILQNFTSQINDTNIFYNKLRNLHGHPLKLPVIRDKNTGVNSSDFESVGFNDVFLRAILTHWNVTPVIDYYDMRDTESDCQLKKSLKDIQFNLTCPFKTMSTNDDISKTLVDQIEWDKLKLLTMFNLNDNKFEASYPVDKDDFCVLVPAGAKIPQAYNFFLALNINIWLLVVLSYIVYSLFLLASQLSGYKTDSRYSDEHCCEKKSIGLEICCVLCKLNCDVPISKQEINTNTKQKSFLLPYILYCFLLNSAYKSILVSFLTKPLYYRSLQSLKDLNGTNFPILTLAENLKFTLESVEPHIASILLPRIELDQSIFKTATFEMDVTRGYFMRQSIANSMKQDDRYIDHNGQPMFHLIKECALPSLMAYVFPRGSPFLEIINELISYTSQGMLRQAPHMTYSKKRHSCSELNCHDLNNSKRNTSFTLDHLQTIFYVYMLGCSSALITFFLELYIDRKKKDKQNKGPFKLNG